MPLEDVGTWFGVIVWDESSGGLGLRRDSGGMFGGMVNEAWFGAWFGANGVRVMVQVHGQGRRRGVGAPG